jgi:hypothetical protein
VRLNPLPGINKPLADATVATSVLLPGDTSLSLDGVNTGRGDSQLVLYAAPKTRSGTNIYGVEVAVSSTGTVLEVSGYGAGDHAIPAGGFILSAHSGSRPQKANVLESLRPGDRVTVLNAHGAWVGGYAPTRLLVGLPGKQTRCIDGQDIARGTGQLVLYRTGHGNGHTGANQFGIEVAVRNGKVHAIREGAGDMAIPDDGFVLSAHGGNESAHVTALRALKPGDVVRLILDKGGQPYDLTAALAERRQAYSVGARCSALYLAVNAGARSSAGTSLGEWVVHYADGARERIPIRYGREALAQTDDSLPARTDDPVWLIDQPPLRCLIREWVNPRPDQLIREVSFEPAPALLSVGADIVAVMAAVSPQGP